MQIIENYWRLFTAWMICDYVVYGSFEIIVMDYLLLFESLSI